jgi:hypothetical protein
MENALEVQPVHEPESTTDDECGVTDPSENQT